MWSTLTQTLTQTGLIDDVLRLILDYWNFFHSLSFLERKENPFCWFLTLRDELPNNSGYVRSVLQNFHSPVQRLLFELQSDKQDIYHAMNTMHPIQALLASSFLLNTPQLAELIVTLDVPDYKYVECKEIKERERWQSKFVITLPSHLVQERFVLQVIENKDKMTFQDLQQRSDFFNILLPLRNIIPQAGMPFLQMARPFIKRQHWWIGVIQGILGLDSSEDKTQQLTYAKANTLNLNPPWDQIVAMNTVWSKIASSNDIEMAKTMIPWKTIENEDKDKLLYLALKRATRKRQPNDAMLSYIHQWHNAFSTTHSCSTFEMSRSLQHPLAKSILQSSRIKITDGIPFSSLCLEFLLQHKHLEEKNVLIAKWTSHPALRNEACMQIWNKHDYPLLNIPTRKRKLFSFIIET
jgi:hypothetical protein